MKFRYMTKTSLARFQIIAKIIYKHRVWWIFKRQIVNIWWYWTIKWTMRLRFEKRKLKMRYWLLQEIHFSSYIVVHLAKPFNTENNLDYWSCKINLFVFSSCCTELSFSLKCCALIGKQFIPLDTSKVWGDLPDIILINDTIKWISFTGNRYTLSSKPEATMDLCTTVNWIKLSGTFRCTKTWGLQKHSRASAVSKMSTNTRT